MDNAEIGNLCKIIGLQFGKKYETEADMKNLRYGHLMIMADQDIDGSHIKGLVINFIHAHWPSLLKLPFLEEFITPIVKVNPLFFLEKYLVNKIYKRSESKMIQGRVGADSVN